MDRLIYTALSGASQTLYEQQISANNPANVNTNGFRADMAMATNDKVKGGGFDTRYMAQEGASGVNDSTGVAEKPNARWMWRFRARVTLRCRIKTATKSIPATAIFSRTTGGN